MANVKVFDPPMCCSTGVCGPDADDEPAQFAAALDWAQKNGVNVDRFNLGHDAGEFVQDATVKGLLESDGVECLPLVFVDGDVLTKGGYPSRTVLAEKLGIAAQADGQKEEAKASSGCCS